MTDIVDAAQRLEEGERAAAIDTVRGLVARPACPSIRCVDCREPIEFDRRRAVPSARRCLECQEALERREKGL